MAEGSSQPSFCSVLPLLSPPSFLPSTNPLLQSEGVSALDTHTAQVWCKLAYIQERCRKKPEVLLIPGFCNMMSVHGGAEFLIFVSPLPFCDLGSQFWCWPLHHQGQKWLLTSCQPREQMIKPNSFFISTCQGAKPISGLPLPLDFTGDVGVSHEELSGAGEGGWGRRSHVVWAVPPCPKPPGLSPALCCSSSQPGSAFPASALFWCPLEKHPAQQVETFLGCSSPPSLSPAALN